MRDSNGCDIHAGDIVRVFVDQEPYGAGETFTEAVEEDADGNLHLTGEHAQFNLKYADEIEIVGHLDEGWPE